MFVVLYSFTDIKLLLIMQMQILTLPQVKTSRANQ